jgi:hypothetical protein
MVSGKTYSYLLALTAALSLHDDARAACPSHERINTILRFFESREPLRGLRAPAPGREARVDREPHHRLQGGTHEREHPGAVRRHALGIAEGDVLSLGSFTPPLKPEAGMTVTVRYEGLPGNPAVTVRFK